MYFEIENTPERRARRKKVASMDSPKEECPRLILAPFSRPPKLMFDNVLIGETCRRELEIYNPSKQVQKITLGKALPPGFIIHLPDTWLVVEPESCYSLTMEWSPIQPTALKETVCFKDESRGRYDVNIILKSVMKIKGKVKGFKTSPGKSKKKTLKRSPVAVYKKKAEIIYNSKQVRKSDNVVHREYSSIRSSNKENVEIFYENNSHVQDLNCPFDSPNSIDLNFDTSEIFANMRKPKANILQNTYDTLSESNNIIESEPYNVLKPSNLKVFNSFSSDMFDNLKFTPLKTIPPISSEKLEKVPNIVLSMNSDSELDDSLNVKTSNKEYETQSLMQMISQPNKWLTVNHQVQSDNPSLETPQYQKKKIPNTSSPKELNSPNFTINTEWSRISDLSFAPQRCSTDRKTMVKFNNDTHDVLDEIVSSETYTKESPYTPLFGFNLQTETGPPHYFSRDNPKLCRQALFTDYKLQKDAFDKNYIQPFNHNNFQEMRTDFKSPTRSLSPPLQSIPEESTQNSHTQILDESYKQSTFTINRTFEKIPQRISISNKSTWSKKAPRADPEIWKIPVSVPRKSLKPKQSLTSKDSLGVKEGNGLNKSMSQSISLNKIGNVYSQSFSVDPFMSSTYFYDEEEVEKIGKEFKRWLNYILTPPADLDSNVDQKLDVGKAWIENRNKEIPAAPTKEYVSSMYHNSHRLESLRKAAKALLHNSEIVLVMQKLNAQIEKKLIAIRSDRNLHLDVGLQKTIMELLLAYNPLWLRIGLEAIYNLVLPLKSNNDIDGLSTFIIQRMFKNPNLKNKHCKSSAPNMLLPAYMEAVKKFSLKKFFLLVFFLDQAKQRKLIPHDPCLFCRNAICKESREVIIRFTRELIAGIGDITKHLRPLGYVVSHKQTYLDEYKYAVHNIAIDIRDGVRLTKVMEIILIKNGLLNQLRTPAISRLQKIHNVQVALNALKEANFEIAGDITASDIADGHREKTLSLLWQIIHVFRAPLFEKAASVIQTWWKKKYKIIVEKRKEEARIIKMKNHAASTIQCWWRRIQYNRLVEWQMMRVTSATVTIQKYCRMWLCRSHLRKLKQSVTVIENWYKSIKLIRKAKLTLQTLKSKRDELRQKSAITIQSNVRRWLCTKHYKLQLKSIILIQSLIRCFIVRKKYKKMLNSTIYIQKFYRSKLLTRKEMTSFNLQRKSAVVIQSFFKMYRQRNNFLALKKSVRTIEKRYIAIIEMRKQLHQYRMTKEVTIKMQSLYRGKRCRAEYLKKRSLIIKLQIKIRAHLLMKKERQRFLQLKNAACILQKRMKSYLTMKKVRKEYIIQRKSAILIQQYFRAYLACKRERNHFVQLKRAATIIQNRYRSLITMRKVRCVYLILKTSVIYIQRQYRSQTLMKKLKNNYEILRMATITIQRKYRALVQMRIQRQDYLELKSACIKVQNAYRAKILGRKQRQHFVEMKNAAGLIQNWYRNLKKTSVLQIQYQKTKAACITIQQRYRVLVVGRNQRKEYLLIKESTIRIQKFYRLYIEMKTLRDQYIKLKTATVTIQKYYRSYLITKRQRCEYLKIKSATVQIQNFYRRCRLTEHIRTEYCKLRGATIFIQQKYRAKRAMLIEFKKYTILRQAVRVIQSYYKATLAMRAQRQIFELRAAAIIIQTRFRAQMLMRKERNWYSSLLKACVAVQTRFRAKRKGKNQRQEYLKWKEAAVTIQNRLRAYLAMKKNREQFLKLRAAAITLQQRYRATCLMKKHRAQFLEHVSACLVIQRAYRNYLICKKQQREYILIRMEVIKIQQWYRNTVETRRIQNEYKKLQKVVRSIQRIYRTKLLEREKQRVKSAKIIQAWYSAVKIRKECRQKYMKIRRSVVIVQSVLRMYTCRKQFLKTKKAALIIQSYYRSYKQTMSTKQQYHKFRIAIIKLQSKVRTFLKRKRYLQILRAIVIIQSAYREKKKRNELNQLRTEAAVILQKNIRRYMAQTKYQRYRKSIMLIQRLWRGKLITRLTRCEFLQKRRLIIKLQALSRGYLVRKQVQFKKELLMKMREEQKREWAASKILALFRGHRVRQACIEDSRVANLRRRWRAGALKSQQESLKERNDEVIELLPCMTDIETMIRVFKSLDLLTEVMPMKYDNNAPTIVMRVYIYMSAMNRSISSVQVLKHAASCLVNLAKYRVTGPKIYKRELIPPILKFMLRFSNSETDLFCILTTYLWLFAKYDSAREDLTTFLHIPENHKLLLTIKENVERMKRMEKRSRNKFNTPQPCKTVSHTGHSKMNYSICTNASNVSKCDIILPALEPDYGIIRADKPRYFTDPLQAITCLFHAYNL